MNQETIANQNLMQDPSAADELWYSAKRMHCVLHIGPAHWIIVSRITIIVQSKMVAINIHQCSCKRAMLYTMHEVTFAGMHQMLPWVYSENNVLACMTVTGMFALFVCAIILY